MDNELESIIKFLNTNPKRPTVSQNRGFRIRNSKTSHNNSHNLIKNKLISESKSTVSSLQPLKEIIIEEDLLSEIQEFYKEEDEQYKQEIATKTGAPVLWMRKDSKDPDESLITSIKVKKYLSFRPYIDPMSLHPPIFSESVYFFRMQNSDVKLIRYTLEDNGFKESAPNSNAWTMMWHGGPLKNSLYQSLTKYQKVNHFPRSHEITRKDFMYKNLAKMQVLHGARAFDFVPKTYIMPQDAGQLEYEMNLMEATWIIKPSASSQGKGIFLTSRFSEVPKKDHVVSQYIENPLLIDGLKFDLRIYVAITCFNPLRIYMYKEGLVRFATQKYNNTGKGRFMFLTNYSVNKYSENFVENNSATEDGKGSKWSITALRKLFAEQGIEDEKLWAKIKDLVIKAILSIEGLVFSGCEMHLPYRSNCFELLGFDVLIDDTLNPWLLEVNLSPSMNCDAPIDQKIKGEMISDLFTLTGIVSVSHRHNNKNGHTQNKALNLLAYMQKNNYSQGKPKRNSDAHGRTGFDSFGDVDNREERAIIKETNDEYKRRGKFERIFPSELSVNYKNLFERERPYNTILFNYLGKVYRKGQGSSAVVYQKTQDED